MSGARRPLALLVAAAALVAAGWVPLAVVAGHQAAQAATCGVPAGAAAVVDPATAAADGLTPEQAANAAHILNAAAALGLDRQAQTLGVMTALGESGLAVLDHGDAAGPDSRGLFQQRDNGAWGTYEQRMDPTASATAFFRALQAVPGWQSLPPTLAASRVQGNADPFHYERYYASAVAVVQQLGAAAAVPVAAGPAPALSLGPVKPHAAALAAEINQRFRPYQIGGWRPSARDPGGHPAGLAIDVMVRSRAEGDAVAAWVQANAARLSVDYVLWWQRSWSPDRAAQGWRGMADRGNPTENHIDHLHINVLPVPGTGTGPAVDAAGAACAPGAPVGADGWAAPAAGRLTSGYGVRLHPVTGATRMHTGIDLGAPAGSPIAAAADGVVVAAGPRGGYGTLLVVDHGGGVRDPLRPHVRRRAARRRRAAGHRRAARRRRRVRRAVHRPPPALRGPGRRPVRRPRRVPRRPRRPPAAAVSARPAGLPGGLPAARWADVPRAAHVTARAFGRLGHRPGPAGAVLAAPLTVLLLPALAAARARGDLLAARAGPAVAVATVRRPGGTARLLATAALATAAGGAAVGGLTVAAVLVLGPVPAAAVLAALLLAAAVDGVALARGAKGLSARLGVSAAALAARRSRAGRPTVEVGGLAAWPPGRGAARALLAACLPAADAAGLDLALAVRRPELLTLYAAHGWAQDDAGPLLRRAGARPVDPDAALTAAGQEMADVAARAGVPAPPVLVVPRLRVVAAAHRADGPLAASTVRVHPVTLAAPPAVRRQLLAHELAHVHLHHDRPAAAAAVYSSAAAAAAALAAAAAAAAVLPRAAGLATLAVAVGATAAAAVRAHRAAARSRRLEHEADDWARQRCGQPVTPEHLAWAVRRGVRPPPARCGPSTPTPPGRRAYNGPTTATTARPPSGRDGSSRHVHGRPDPSSARRHNIRRAPGQPRLQDLSVVPPGAMEGDDFAVDESQVQVATVAAGGPHHLGHVRARHPPPAPVPPPSVGERDVVPQLGRLRVPQRDELEALAHHQQDGHGDVEPRPGRQREEQEDHAHHEQDDSEPLPPPHPADAEQQVAAAGAVDDGLSTAVDHGVRAPRRRRRTSAGAPSRPCATATSHARRGPRRAGRRRP